MLASDGAKLEGGDKGGGIGAVVSAGDIAGKEAVDDAVADDDTMWGMSGANAKP